MSRYAGRSRELGAFLRERRSRLTPTAAGLPEGLSRRTPGLRREEIADIAGLSVGYYVRLEQGHAPHPSDSVLDALARTFGLTDDESPPPASTDRKWYPGGGARGGGAGVTLGAPAARTVHPAHGRDRARPNRRRARLEPGRGGVVPRSAASAGEKPGSASNNARYIFLTDFARDFFVDWPEVADDTVAHLRSSAGHLVDDPTMRALVDELTAASPDFANRWARRDVRERVSGDKTLNHPQLGRITIDYQVTALLDTPGQWLVGYSFAPATATHLTKLLDS
ncbi:MAG TPA: helix-turn-helix transcriptional regulator [Kribbella sp.]